MDSRDILFGALIVGAALCVVASPLWLALSDRFLGTDFYGLNDDKSASGTLNTNGESND